MKMSQGLRDRLKTELARIQNDLDDIAIVVDGIIQKSNEIKRKLSMDPGTVIDVDSLDMRILRILRRNQIVTWSDLFHQSPERISRLQGIGESSLWQIRVALNRRGLSLRGDAEKLRAKGEPA